MKRDDVAERDLDPVERAVAGRRSVRAFRPDPVQRALVERILGLAAWAPSGTNMQPWKVYVLTGERLSRLAEALSVEHQSGDPVAEYKYYPDRFFEPYQSRRRTVGFGLYGLLGIERGDVARMRHQHGRNFAFFGAPVGMIFTLDRRLEIGSWLDYGMFLENIMILARAHGLETCAQAAFAPFHATIRRHLPIDETEIVVCGMSLGFEDETAPENALRTEREPPQAFSTFLGWQRESDDVRA